MKEIKAVLFDMDGVLLDTETLCRKSWRITAEKYGVQNIDEIFLKCVGRSRTDSTQILRENISDVVDAALFRSTASEIFQEIEEKEGIELKPFVKECLEKLKASGVRIALASSTRKEMVLKQLERAGILHYFETVTTGDMVEHSKPEPDIYLMAASSLGIDCESCVAVEDSPNGVKSAYGAGIKCFMIPDLILPDEEIKEKAFMILNNLKEFYEAIIK